MLEYPGGHSVITRVLIREGKRTKLKKVDVMIGAEFGVTCFVDKERGQVTRNADSLSK